MINATIATKELKRIPSDGISKAELFSCLGSHDANIAIRDHSGNVIEGILQAVSREDGSGNNFNLLIQLRGSVAKRSIFVRAY